MRRNKRHHDFEGAATVPVGNAIAQRRLTVGAVNDPLEHEADRTADKVMRMPESPLVQRKSASNSDYDDEHVHKKPLINTVPPFIQAKGTENSKTSDAVSNKIRATKGGGSSIQGQTKSFMESRFGHDFSDVRIHTGSDASQMSKELNAQAFTVGRDIYFNDGKYAVNSKEGKWLLAHELTHVMQQDEPSVIRRSTVSSHYGDFKDESYKTLADGSGKNVGVEMYMKFHSNNNVDAKKIAMMQSVRTVVNGAAIAIGGDATIQSRMIKATDAKSNSSPVLNTDEGIQIDQDPRNRNPSYAVDAVNDGDTKLSQGNTPGPVTKLPVPAPGPFGELYNGWGVHGFHFVDGGAPKDQDAELHDTPMAAPIGKNSEQLFETTALAIEGNQEGTYYGSVEWGWRTDASNAFTRIPLAKKSNGTPSSSLLKAAEIWNTGTNSAGKKNIPLPTATIFFINKLWGVRLNAGLVNRGPLANDLMPFATRVKVLEVHVSMPFSMVDSDLTGKAKVQAVDSSDSDVVGRTGWVNFSDLKNERP